MTSQRRKLIKFVIALTLTASLFAFNRAATYACTPPVGGLRIYSVADHVQYASIVLEGVVTSVGGTAYGQMADVQVLQYFKGSGPAAVRISNLGPTSVCLSPVVVGDHKIFYAQGDPHSGLRAVYLSQFDAVASADPVTIDQVEKVPGVTPTAPQKPLGTGQNINTSIASLSGAAVGLIVGSLLGATGVFLVMRRLR